MRGFVDRFSRWTCIDGIPVADEQGDPAAVG